MGQKFQHAKVVIEQQQSPGFDNRKLLKVTLREGEKVVPDFENISGVEIVSQEAGSVILAFVDNEAISTFESRLATLAREGEVTRKELLYVIEDFDRWSPEDRLGTALSEQGWPETETFCIDVELWPQDRPDRRDAMLQAFVAWATQQGMEKLDTLKQVSLVMVRVRCRLHHADVLLNHRDVRTVDLPPQFGVSVGTLLADIDQFPPITAPESGVPCIGVLDSGITSGHPLLKPAMGDAQGFVPPDLSPNDAVPNGHGTFVAGLALYGDVASRIRDRQFIPELRLVSGKVFQDDGTDQTEFVEKSVEKAVRYFLENYQCRVFNLSYGDRNKIYDGRRVRGLAYTLDRLTRELNVLFVVPTGNFNTLPDNPHTQYPAYLFADHARLLDPATALNVITVGGLATLTASRNAQRHPNTIEDIPIAQPSQPAPFTRCGLSVGGAIKPDLVEEAGNLAAMRDGNRTQRQGLGIVSFNSGFASGTLFNENIGTSFASPIVAHKAAKLLAVLPDASANLLRALLAAHARWPDASKRLLNADNKAAGRNQLLQLVGYGRVQEEAMYQSLAQTVTLLAEDRIAQNKHHFYELPVPDDFLTANRRTREVTVALAYSPTVRTTRLDYRHTKLSFSLVAASSLEQVEQAFTRGRSRTQKLEERDTNRLIPDDSRKKGTLQMSRWTFQGRLGDGKKLFVVITRQDAAWSTAQDEDESYALTVTLNDRENVNVTVSLYERIQALLNVRVQQRVRLRSRG
ncbi:MAG: S8 family peptidase [Thiothrix sp.]